MIITECTPSTLTNDNNWRNRLCWNDHPLYCGLKSLLHFAKLMFTFFN